jgi:beta-phosphoglucomutase-like phosphatase (HAD superfamily)
MDAELVIFDCDGVLVDSEILSFEAEAEALAEFGIRVTSADLIERFLGMSSVGAFAILEKDHGIRLPPDFAERSRQRVIEAFDNRLRPIPGIAECWRAFRGGAASPPAASRRTSVARCR